MLRTHHVTCVLPAYNAAATLARTLERIPPGLVDEFILVDDGSSDDTVAIARRLQGQYPLRVLAHARNRGYGANQKTCYSAALQGKASIVVMLHPDLQYEPRLLGALCELIASETYDIALGSRMLASSPLKGGMPLLKYVVNRVLTKLQNLLLGQRLSEYHTGYRAYSRRALEQLDFQRFSDDFLFDNQLLVEAGLRSLQIGECSIPTRYANDSSSIGLLPGICYACGVVGESLHGLWRRSIKRVYFRAGQS